MKFTTDTIHLLELLANVVMADKYVRRIEVDAFTIAAERLGVAEKDGTPLGRKALSAWFNLNHPVLYERYSGASREAELAHLLTAMKDRPDKDDIKSAIQNIATSDDEFHANEKHILALLDAHW